MSLLDKFPPTRDEFREAVKKDLFTTFPNCTEADINSMLESDDGKMYIEDGYVHNKNLFDNGKITREQFLKGGASAVGYNFYMTF